MLLRRDRYCKIAINTEAVHNRNECTKSTELCSDDEITRLTLASDVHDTALATLAHQARMHVLPIKHYVAIWQSNLVA